MAKRNVDFVTDKLRTIQKGYEAEILKIQRNPAGDSAEIPSLKQKIDIVKTQISAIKNAKTDKELDRALNIVTSGLYQYTRGAGSTETSGS